MISSPAIGRRPRLTLNIEPLFADAWTQIPVFTRKLAQALLANDTLEIEFANNLVRVPPDLVRFAIRTNTGAYLTDEFKAEDGSKYLAVDPEVPVFYPSNKGRCSGFMAREASTVHDMTPLFMPEAYNGTDIVYFLDNLAEDLRTDEAVFCVSEATRASLIAAVPSVTGRTRLIAQYVDWPDSFALVERNLPMAMRAYAAVIGTIAPRDNLSLLIEALDHSLVIKQNLYFVVLGEHDQFAEELLSGVSPAQRERVIFSGPVTEFVKYRLLRNAQFVVVPSLFEGFSAPALEAMSLGKPVLAARSSSLPEVVGDAGVYFDPLSIDEFAYALAEIANPHKIAELAPRATKRNAEFTPERMVAPVIEWAKAL
jgi:glycosyltransferase involved in cell wall biosynthesis